MEIWVGSYRLRIPKCSEVFGGLDADKKSQRNVALFFSVDNLTECLKDDRSVRKTVVI